MLARRVDPIQFRIFKIKQLKNMLKRAMNTLGELFLKYKKSKTHSQANDISVEHLKKLPTSYSPGKDSESSSSEFSSDLDRDEEQDEVEEFLSKSKDFISGKARSSKYVPTKLEMIPEASVRFEDTLTQSKPINSKQVNNSRDKKSKKKVIKKVKIHKNHKH
jgi:hypothetical protein